MKLFRLNALVIGLWLAAGCGDSSGSRLTLDPDTPGQLREASLGLVSETWEEVADSLELWAKRLGGYTLSRTRDTDRHIRLELQVPVQTADTFLYIARRLGRVFDERIERQAVSNKLATTQTELKEKEEAIKSLEKRLKTTSSPDERSDLESRLKNLQEEYQTFKQELDDLSTGLTYVRIYLQIENAAYASLKEGGKFWPKFTQGLSEGWHLFLYFLIGMAYLWWMWLGLGLFIALAVWHHRRRQRKKPPTPPTNA